MRQGLSVLTLVYLFMIGAGRSAGAADDWLEARSDHFTIVSDASEGRAKDTLEDLEQLRRLITQIFPAQRVDSTRPAVFYLFKNEKSMRPFQPTRDGEREEWAGMFRSTPLQDVVLILADGKPESVRQLAFSQYTHLLGSYDESRYPVWLSNGLASFYANTEISNKRANIGKMRDSYRRVLGEFRSIPIRDLFAVDYGSDYYRDLSKRPLFDAQSWALVHYLLIGQVQNNGPIRLGRYVNLLAQGRDPLLSFQEAMGRPASEIDEDVGLYIRKQISQYIQVPLTPLELKEELRVRKLDPADASAHMGQLYVATRYDEEAEAALTSSIEAKPDQVAAYESLAALRERQQRPTEALPFYTRAVRNGSSNPHVHLRYAQIWANEADSNRRPEEEEAAVLDSLRLVLRDAPELTAAAELFGYLSLDDAETRVEGHRVVSQALERDPNDPSLVFMLGQLYSQDGAYAAARALFRRLLDGELDPAFNATVRRQYDYADTRLKQEAARAAAAAAARAAANASGTEPSAPGDEAGTDSVTVPSGYAKDATRVDEVSTVQEIQEVRGTLVRFDCTDGHRFVVSAGDVTYTLEIVDLARVEILENGKHAGTRELYCGPQDGSVVVRFMPAPPVEGAKEHRGRLAAIDFIG